MPLRSLHSPVLKWPNRGQMDQAVRNWAVREAPRHPELLRLGYYGSYARGDWGVGSDLDLIAVVHSADVGFERRSLNWDLRGFDVPTELVVYTEREAAAMEERESRFFKVMDQETVWVFESASTSPPRAG